MKNRWKDSEWHIGSRLFFLVHFTNWESSSKNPSWLGSFFVLLFLLDTIQGRIYFRIVPSHLQVLFIFLRGISDKSHGLRQQLFQLQMMMIVERALNLHISTAIRHPVFHFLWPKSVTCDTRQAEEDWEERVVLLNYHSCLFIAKWQVLCLVSGE